MTSRRRSLKLKRSSQLCVSCKTSDLATAVETKQKEKTDLEAQLTQLRVANKALRTKIGDIAESGATSEADLTAATVIRKEEHARI